MKYSFKILTYADEKHLLKMVRRKKELHSLHWDLRLNGSQALPAFKTIRYEYEVPRYLISIYLTLPYLVLLRR